MPSALAKPRNESTGRPRTSSCGTSHRRRAGAPDVRLTAELRANVDGFGPHAAASWRRRTRSGARSSATSTTALSSSSWRSRCSSACSSGSQRTRARPADAVPAPGGLQRRARRPPRPRARIYPPLLADKGLAVALEAQGRKAAVPTTVEPDGVGRYPREVESAVYFCALEACRTSRSTRTRPRWSCGSASGTAGSSSRSRTTAEGSTPPRRRTAPGCRGWPIASTRSAARSRSGAPPGTGTLVRGEDQAAGAGRRDVVTGAGARTARPSAGAFWSDRP